MSLIRLLLLSIFAASLGAQTQWSMGFLESAQDPTQRALVNWSAVTHIMDFGVSPASDGSLVCDFGSEPCSSSAFTTARADLISTAHSHGDKVLMCVTDANGAGGFTGAASSGTLSTFVANIMSMVNTNGYDGVDLDWEASDYTTRMPALISALRTALGSSRLLAVDAIPGTQAFWAANHPNMDRINFMTYDQEGNFNPYTWFNAALFSDPGDGVWSLDLMKRRAIAAGVPAAKINLGIPFYGYRQTGPTGPRQSVAGNPALVQITYRSILSSFPSQAASPTVDSVAKVPWFSITGGWVEYDNPASVTAKVNYIKAQSLGGWILFSLNKDASGQPLAAAVATAMGGSTAPPSVPADFFGNHMDVGPTNGSTPILAPMVVGAHGKPAVTDWEYIETSRGVYNWNALDQAVSRAQTAGTPIFVSHQWVPPFATSNPATCGVNGLQPNQCSAAPTDLNISAPCQGSLAGTTTTDCMWKEFLTSLVQRYKSTGIQTGCSSGSPQCHGVIQMYEGWNEPPFPTPMAIADFVMFETDFLNTIRSNDASAKVGSPAFIIDPSVPSYATFMANFFANGGPKTYDTFDFHINAAQPEAQIALINQFKSILSTAGVTNPVIYATEAGRSWSCTAGPPSDAAQQAYAGRIEPIYWSNGIKRHYWYAYSICGPQSNQTASNTLTPLGIAYGNVANWMLGSTMGTLTMSTGDPLNSTFTATLTKSGTAKIIAWHSGAGATYTPPSGYISYTDVNGATHAISGTTVNLTNSPILLQQSPAGPGPTISTFSANPSVISPGASSTLTIAASGATSCSLSPGSTVTCNGTVLVSPSATTLYTLTATNNNGSATAQTQVTVSGPTNYFVSSSGGNDANAGTSSAAPWQSLAKVKAGPAGGYAPGTIISFKSGDTWSGVSMNTLTAGTSSQRITYNSYGAGAKPIIDGTATVATLFSVSDDFITIDGLDLRNSTSTLINAPGRGGIIVKNCSLKNAGGHVFNSAFAISGDITFDNNTYTVDAGRTSSTNMVEIWTDQNSTIQVTNNTLDRRLASGALNGSGIVIPGAWGAVMTGNVVRGGTQGIGVKPYQRPSDGVNCQPGDPGTQNGIISHNYMDNISTRQGDGEAVELEGCIAGSGGDQTGFTVSNNVIVCMSDNTVGVGSSDAIGGFHASGSKVWGNLIFGGCGIATGSTTPRMITFSSASTNNNVYNNTIVGPGAGVSPFPLSAIAYLSSSSGIARNNIITGVERGVAQYTSSTVSQGSNLFFDVSSNTFGTVTDLGNTLVGDPLFTVTNPTSANGAKLLSGSPAVGSGANLGSPYNLINDPNGAGPFIYPDFNQSSLWMRGAFGFGGGPPPPIITDFEANPTSINSGQSSQLTCTASNFTNLQIVGVGNVASGVPISVSPTSTTQYICRATNTVTHVDAFATVTVNAPPPVITSFTANPVTIITGQSSALQWTTTGATSCSINNGVGTVGCNTSRVVTPAVTTTYRLTAVNPANVSDFQDVTIAVNVPKSIIGAVMQGAIIP